MNKKKLARSVAAALAVSLVAASCAGDEETTDTTAATSEEAAETTTEAMEDEEAAETTEAMEDEEAADAEANIVEAAQGSEDFSILVEAVVAAGLVEALSDTEGEFTVFAPTNEAFEAFLTESDTTKEELLENPDLADILKNHVLATKVDSAAALEAATAESSVETLQGEELALSLDGDNIKVGEATVVTADIETTNGVIHAIDLVIPLG